MEKMKKSRCRRSASQQSQRQLSSDPLPSCQRLVIRETAGQCIQTDQSDTGSRAWCRSGQQEAFDKKTRAIYCDKVIVDKVTCHGNNPIRKLGPQDRLVAPCRMALKHGIYPKTLIDTIAKALYFDEPTDESAMKLKEMRQTHGIEYVLQNVCEMDKDEPLYAEVTKSVETLKDHWTVKRLE